MKKQSDIAFGVEFIDLYPETDIWTAVTNTENTNESDRIHSTAVGPFILPSKIFLLPGAMWNELRPSEAGWITPNRPHRASISAKLGEAEYLRG
jgi:hypothetical protein